MELAGFLAAGDDVGEGLAALQEAIADKPKDAPLHLRLAQLLRRTDRFDEAMTEAQAALAIDPQLSQARVLLSDLLLLKREPAKALREAYLAAITGPDSGQAYSHLGHVLHITGDVAAAELAYRRALAIDRRSAHYHHQLSVALLALRRGEEAIKAAEEAQRLDPDAPRRVAHLETVQAQVAALRGAGVPAPA